MCEIEDSNKLQKKLKLLDVFVLATGTTLSAGFFLLPGLAAEKAGSSIIFAYILAAIPLIPATFCTIELTTAMPRAGGFYYILDRALGPVFGTVGGIGTWLAMVLKVAFALIAMGFYLSLFLPSIPIVQIAVLLAVLIGILNLAGSRMSGSFQIVLVMSLLILLVVFIGGGIPEIQFQNFNGIFDISSNSLVATAAMVHVSYAGLTKVTSLSEEVKDPERNLTYGIFISLAVALVVYVLGTIVMVGVIPMDILSGDVTPVATAANYIFGKYGVMMVSFAALLAFISVANAGTMSASRFPLAMSRDNMMPQFLQKLSSRRMPHYSIFVTVLAIVLILTLLDTTNIAKLASAFQLLMFLLVCVAVIVMRESRIDSYDPGYRSPFYPWMPILGIISSYWLLSGMGIMPKLFSVAMIIVSVIWYMIYVKKRVMRRGAIFNMFENLGKSRTENLDRELRGILKEKGLRKDDPFDELVTRSHVIDIKEKTGFEEIVNIVSKKFASVLHLYEDEIKKPFLEGTRVGNTPVTKEVALPHFRLKNISEMEMVIVRAKNGVVVKFQNPLKGFEEDIQTVRAIFFLISPENNANLHLRILAQVAGIVEDEQFRDNWLNANDEQEIKEILIHDERYLSFTLKNDSGLIGLKIREVNLPDKCLFAIIKRDNEIVVPDGETVFKQGDKVTLLGEPLSIAEFQKLYITGN